MSHLKMIKNCLTEGIREMFLPAKQSSFPVQVDGSKIVTSENCASVTSYNLFEVDEI